ncbi:MAG: GNAT family N-acetyltransferase [Nanoarchaeota archaeon]|mgnify:CR=1 FL=1
MISQVQIKSVSQDEKKKSDSFSLKEWVAYNKEKKYIYKEKEFRYAAYLNGKIVGYIYGNTNGGVAYLDDLLVGKKNRNQGIGKLLLKKFEEIAKKNQCHACLLATTDKHVQAIVFYKNNGYRIEAQLKHMYWNVTEYYMVKRLT